MRPVATTASNTTVDTTAKSVAREAGTASPFQIPPRPARLPSVVRPGSARAANAATSGTRAQIWSADDKPRIAAVNHGSAATTASANVTAAHSQRGLGPPGPSTGTATQTNPTAAARISPVGVSPANAIQNANVKRLGQDSTVGRPQRQHRRRHPRQAAVSKQQTPMPLQEPLTDVRIPDRQRDRHELTAGTGLWQYVCDKSSRTPARQPQPGDEQGLHHDAAVDAVRGQRDREILRRRPWSRNQPEGTIG